MGPNVPEPIWKMERKGRPEQPPPSPLPRVTVSHATPCPSLHNRLTGVDAAANGSLSDPGDVRFSYDSSGVRVSETTVPAAGESLTTTYLIDPLNPTGYAKAVEESAQTTTAGVAGPRQLTRTTLLGLKVEGQADTAAGAGAGAGGAVGGVSYFLTDGHGSTRGLLDLGGKLTERDDYDAFGTRLQTGASKTTWLFGGDGAYDPATGWTYHLARWRDGFRFTSYDSFEADPSSPASLHKYLYGNASPTYYLDPSGHNGLPSLLVSIGIGISILTVGAIGLGVASVGVGTVGKSIGNSIWPNGVPTKASSISSFDKNLAYLAEDVYRVNPQGHGDWEPVGTNDLSGLKLPSVSFQHNGFRAQLYKSSSLGYVLAFKGTDITSGDDWYTNITQGVAGTTIKNQYADAIGLARDVKSAIGAARLTLVGHSLGGGLAHAAAISVNAPAVTFNVAGLSSITTYLNGGSRFTSSIANYVVKGDVLSRLQNNVAFFPNDTGGNFILTPASADAGKSSAELHGIAAVIRALGAN